MKKLFIMIFISIYFISCTNEPDSWYSAPIIVTNIYYGNKNYCFYKATNLDGFYDSCNKHRVGDTIQLISTHH